MSQWLPAAVFGLIYLVAAIADDIRNSRHRGLSEHALTATPGEFALYVFQHHWFSIEVISMLLLLALIGALHPGMGRGAGEQSTPRAEEEI